MKETILLLVEDNPETADMMVAWLEKCEVEHETIVAHDGAEALDYLYGTGAHRGRDATVMPAVVLLNLSGCGGPGSEQERPAAPLVGGLEVLRQIRNDPRTRLLPIVMLSSSDKEPDLRNSYELGANSYVRIPTVPSLFAETIKELGSYWLRFNDPPPQMPFVTAVSGA